MPENDSPATDTPKTPKTPRIPRPPSREEVEQISEAQSMITDDWTGEGGTSDSRPADSKPSGKPDNSDRPDDDQKR